MRPGAADLHGKQDEVPWKLVDTPAEDESFCNWCRFQRILPQEGQSRLKGSFTCDVLCGVPKFHCSPEHLQP